MRRLEATVALSRPYRDVCGDVEAPDCKFI